MKPTRQAGQQSSGTQIVTPMGMASALKPLDKLLPPKEMRDWLESTLSAMALYRQHGRQIYIQNYIKPAIVQTYLANTKPGQHVVVRGDDEESVHLTLIRYMADKIDDIGSRMKLNSLGQDIHEALAPLFQRLWREGSALAALMTCKEQMTMTLLENKYPTELLRKDDKLNRDLVVKLTEAMAPIKTEILRHTESPKVWQDHRTLSYDWVDFFDFFIDLYTRCDDVSGASALRAPNFKIFGDRRSPGGSGGPQRPSDNGVHHVQGPGRFPRQPQHSNQQQRRNDSGPPRWGPRPLDAQRFDAQRSQLAPPRPQQPQQQYRAPAPPLRAEQRPPPPPASTFPSAAPRRQPPQGNRAPPNYQGQRRANQVEAQSGDGPRLNMLRRVDLKPGGKPGALYHELRILHPLRPNDCRPAIVRALLDSGCDQTVIGRALVEDYNTRNYLGDPKACEEWQLTLREMDCAPVHFSGYRPGAETTSTKAVQVLLTFPDKRDRVLIQANIIDDLGPSLLVSSADMARLGCEMQLHGKNIGHDKSTLPDPELFEYECLERKVAQHEPTLQQDGAWAGMPLDPARVWHIQQMHGHLCRLEGHDGEASLIEERLDYAIQRNDSEVFEAVAELMRSRIEDIETTSLAASGLLHPARLTQTEDAHPTRIFRTVADPSAPVLTERVPPDYTDEELAVEPDLAPDLAPDPIGALGRTLREVLQSNIPANVPREPADEMLDIAEEFHDVFEERLSCPEGMRVPPAVETFMAPMHRIPTHRRPVPDPVARNWLQGHTSYLEQINAVARVDNAPYAAPSQVILKANGSFRHVVDCRPVNANLAPSIAPLPDLDTIMVNLAGSVFFGTDDLTDGFWQVPCEPGQMFFSTPDGIYESLRVLQGAKNSTAHLRAALRYALGDLIGAGIEGYVDDNLRHAPTFLAFKDLYRRYLERCRTANVKLKPSKCVLIAYEVPFCGHYINSKGFRRDPRHLPDIMALPSPSTAKELQCVLGLMNWMRTNIPMYATLAGPLQDLLNASARSAKTFKGSKLKRVPLAWSEVHEKALVALKDAVCKMPLRFHPCADMVFNLFTDASDTAFGSMLTQLPVGDDVDSGNHQPLAFRSGRFAGSALNWSTPDKEGFAIIDAMRSLQHILCVSQHKIRIFTDHRNLTFLLGPKATPGPINLTRMARLERWALLMQPFDYEICYFPGELNAWADLFSRALASDDEVKVSEAHASHAHILDPFARVPNLDAVSDDLEDVLPPTADLTTPTGDAEAFDFLEDIASQDSLEARFPPTDDFQRILRNYSLNQYEPPVEGATFDGIHCVWMVKDKVFIPDVSDLRQRLLHIFHDALHLSKNGLFCTLSSVYHWPGMRADCDRFVRRCLDCLVSSGTATRRPLGRPLHASQPDEIIHFDYLDLPRDGVYGFTKLLVVKDDFTGMIELYPTDSADASHVAKSLAEWFSRHDVARVWISDAGSHFKNQVMHLLAVELGVNHHIVAPYSPQANGTIEVVNRDILRIMRALLSSRRVHEENWVAILDLVVTAVNMIPTAHRGGYSPFELFTGRAPTSLVDVVHNPATRLLDRPLDTAEIQQYLEDLRTHLADSGAEAAKVMEHRRGSNRERHNSRRGVDTSTFQVGDLVLVAQRSDANKLQARWLGPARVTDVSDDGFVYNIVFDVTPPYSMTRHLTFLRPFSADLAGDVVAISDLARHHLASRRVYSEILGIHRKGRGRQWVVVVKPQGFDDEDADELPLKVAYQAIPALLDEYLSREDLPTHLLGDLNAIRKSIARLQ
jgi:hypothetical protein